MFKKFGATLLVMFCTAGAILAQERGQADVQISSINVTEANNRLTCQVTVFSENDDDARDVRLFILLPVEVKFIEASNVCKRVSTPANTDGVVECQLGDLRVRESKTIQVSTTVPPAF